MKYVKRSVNDEVARDTVLEIVFNAGDKGITTGELVEQAEDMLKPNFADRSPPSENGIEPWKRAVYNVISHRDYGVSHVAAGYENYTVDEVGRLTITEEGKAAYHAMVASRVESQPDEAAPSRKSFAPQ